MNKILITGSAGFIGYHLVDRFLQENNFEIVGLDNINDYYDINLKYSRLKNHGIDAINMHNQQIEQSFKYNQYRFIKVDLAEHEFIVNFMKNEKFDYVVNLAAQAGVRNSLINPRAYTNSNIDGFLSILEGCRYSNVKHLVYASTSSVYGLNTKMPLSETIPTEHPISLYSATKKSNELMAHSYSHLFNMPTSGLRFFTVYGPWGRPDMALFIFAEAIFKNKVIDVFNYGKMKRDFTYVSDIVESIKRVTLKPAVSNTKWNGDFPESNTSSAPYQIFNIGNNNPTQLLNYIEALEFAIGRSAKKNLIEIQPGDVPETHADIDLLEKYIDFKPSTSIIDGVSKFVDWYTNYYNI